MARLPQTRTMAPVNPALALGGGDLPGVLGVGGAGKSQLAQILLGQALQRGNLRPGHIRLAKGHREDLRLGPGVQCHEAQG